jgi:hypothetical protein
LKETLTTSGDAIDVIADGLEKKAKKKIDKKLKKALKNRKEEIEDEE